MNHRRFFLMGLFLTAAIAVGCSGGSDKNDSGGAGADFDASLYYTKSALDGGALNNLYYTQTAADALLANKQDTATNKVMGMTGNPIMLTQANVGRANYNTTGWTVPAGAQSVLVKVTVAQNTPSAQPGDVSVRFRTVNSSDSHDPIVSARLSAIDFHTGTTIVGFFDLGFVPAGDTVIHAYIETCTRTYGTDMDVRVSPIMWLR